MPKKPGGLTAREVAKIVADGGRMSGNKMVRVVGDGGGLYLTVLRPGVANWSLRYVVGQAVSEKGKVYSKAREMGLGRVATSPEDKVGITLAQARAKAMAAQVQRATGVDPIEAKREGKPGARPAPGGKTFKDAADAYIAVHGPKWRNAKHRGQWDSSLKDYVFPLIGDLPLASITQDHIERVLTQRPKGQPGGTLLQDRRETGRRVRQRMAKIFLYAITKKWMAGPSPMPPPEAASILLGGEEKKKVRHHPHLQWREVAPFMAQLRKRGGTAARALEFVVLTAARTGEVIGARWSEINMKRAVWTIPAGRMKADVEHSVALSAAALAVLEHMLPLKPEEGDGYVFPGQGKGKPLSNMAMLKTLELMRTADAGLPHFTVHGFRSSFKTWSLSQGWPDHLSEKALAHKDKNEVRAAYTGDDPLIEERRPMMEAWAAWCASTPASSEAEPAAVAA